jgi:hypothetical protein
MGYFSRIEGPEVPIAKEQVIRAIEEKGLNDPEVKRLVMEWTLQEEALVTQKNTSEATIELNISRADLYVAAGEFEYAIICLEYAKLQAWNEQLSDLYNIIAVKISEIEDMKQ